MFYNLLVHVPSNTCCIRPAAQGLTDLEFENKVRMRTQCENKRVLYQIAFNTDFDLVEEDEFSLAVIQEYDDEPKTPQKRATTLNPEIYDRGPYSKYTRG